MNNDMDNRAQNTYTSYTPANDESPHICHKCGRRFSLSQHLCNHLRFKCGKEPRFQCPYCHHRSKWKFNLIKHVRSIHAGEKIFALDLKAKNTFATDCEEFYGCPKCGRRFDRKNILIQHLKYECGKKERFKCPYCEHRSDWKHNLTTHIIRTHANEESSEVHVKEKNTYSAGVSIYCEKLHICPKCGGSFGTAQGMKNHLYNECFQEPRYQCPYCEYRSKRRDHMQVHIRRRHRNQKVFVVDLIDKYISTAGLSVNSKKSYICPSQRRFSLEDNLSSHLEH